jgi:hypothetical protein
LLSRARWQVPAQLGADEGRPLPGRNVWRRAGVEAAELVPGELVRQTQQVVLSVTFYIVIMLVLPSQARDKRRHSSHLVQKASPIYSFVQGERSRQHVCTLQWGVCRLVLGRRGVGAGGGKQQHLSHKTVATQLAVDIKQSRLS